MSTKHLMIIGMLVLLLAACQPTDTGAAGTAPEGSGDFEDTPDTPTAPPEDMETPPMPPAEAGAPDVTIVLDGGNYYFERDGEQNPDIVVQQGDVVRIEFTSVEGYHDWVVDEFDAATDKVQQGGSTSVQFVADQAGTFEYYCSVGQHRQQGMRGNLIVE